MDLQKLTNATQQSLVAARELADAANHQYVTPGHLVLALLGQTDGIVYPLLSRLEVTPTTLRNAVTPKRPSPPKRSRSSNWPMGNVRTCRTTTSR